MLFFVTEDPEKSYFVLDNSAVVLLQSLQLGFLVLLASYFVFNRRYPFELGCFFEFFQMEVLQIFTDESEGARSKLKFKNKANTLYNKIHNSKKKGAFDPEEYTYVFDPTDKTVS